MIRLRFGPWRPDLSAIETPCLEATNVVPNVDHYSPQASLLTYSFPLLGEALGATSVIDKNGTVYWFAGDANNLYINTGTTSWSNISRVNIAAIILSILGGSVDQRFSFGNPPPIIPPRSYQQLFAYGAGTVTVSSVTVTPSVSVSLWGLRGWYGQNVDRDATGNIGTTSLNWTSFVSSVLPSHPEVLREGEGHLLPNSGTGTWTQPGWMTSWPFPFDLVLNNVGGGLAGTLGSTDWQRNLKYRVLKVMTEGPSVTLSFVGITLFNEPDPAPGALGATAAEVHTNLAIGYRAAMEQLRQVAGGDVSNFATLASNIVLFGPTFTGTSAVPRTGWANVYSLFADTTFLQSIDALGSHHHQAVGMPGACWSYGTSGVGTPPQDSQNSLYHLARAAKNVNSNHGLPILADESGLPHYGVIGESQYTGWETFVLGADMPQLDLLRRVQTGPFVTSMMQWGVSLWISQLLFAGNVAGNEMYNYMKPDTVGPFTTYASWDTLNTYADYRRYDINLLSNGFITIANKPWQDFGDPQTICIHCPTRGQPTNSYASGLPPYSQWQRATFGDGVLTFSAGGYNVASRPVWFREIKEYVVSATITVTGAGARARLIVMGHDKIDGTARLASAEVTSGTQNVNIIFTPRQHTKTNLPNPAYALLRFEHNGTGTAAIRDWRIV